MSAFQSSLLSLPSGTVSLDCDGVLLDFIAHFRNVANYALGRELIEQENTYSLLRRFDVNEKELNHVMHVFNKEGGWSGLPPLPGAIDGARALQDAGHRVIVVTAIDDEHKQDRLYNLTKYGFTPDEIYCVGSHTGHTKGQAFATEQPHAHVDDRLIYLKEAIDMVKGHKVELVWVNDGIPQHGHTPEFVHHEVSGLHHWAIPLAQRRNVSFPPKAKI